MARLICLGGSIESLPILRRAKELGHRLIVVDGNPDAPGFALADRCGVASCYHAGPVIRELKIIGEKYDGVLCAAIDAPHVSAAVAEVFGLPGLTVEQAATGADKWEQKKLLHSAGIPLPGFYRFGERLIKKFQTDPGAVMKPLDSRGARGVIRLSPGVDPVWAYEQSRSQSPSGRVMVEEWLDGPQLSTESLVQDGEVLFTAIGLRNYDRLNEFSPSVIEDGFDSPYQAPIETCLEIENLIEDSCKALGWTNCVCKGDLVIHNGRVHVIELAPRLSGGLFCAAHELAHQVDFIGSAIRLALGERLELRDRTHYYRAVSQRYVFPEKSDIGKRITAQEEGDYGAVFAHYSKQIGHVIQPVTAHPDRLGQALCVGVTPQEARERAERAVKEMYNRMVIE